MLIADLALRPDAEVLVSRYSDRSSSPRAVFAQTDVTSWLDLERMFEIALAEFGSFDLVCPGAGVYEPPWSNFWHPPGLSPQSKDDPSGGRFALLDINVSHPIRATQIALSHWLHPRSPGALRASPGNPKRVVHISSVAGQIPVFRAPLYGASKFAITGFVRCLAPLEAETGVKVNAVAPGIVKTPIWTEDPEKLVNVDQENDGWVTPREVAEMMLRCAEDDSFRAGSVWEVGAKHVREVGVYYDPGPDSTPGKGMIASNSSAGDEQVKGWLKDEKIWGNHASKL